MKARQFGIAQLKITMAEYGDIELSKVPSQPAESDRLTLQAMLPFGLLTLHEIANREFHIWFCRYLPTQDICLRVGSGRSYTGLIFSAGDPMPLEFEGIGPIHERQELYLLAHFPLFNSMSYLKKG